MDDKLHTFLDSGPCPDHETLIRYARDLSSPEEAREVELHLAGCPLCSDAVDGFMMMDSETDVSADIAELHARIDAAIVEKESHVFSFRPYMRLAASLVFLFVSVGALYLFLRSEKNNESEKAIANAQPKMDSISPSMVPAAAESDQKTIEDNESKTVVANNFKASKDANGAGQDASEASGYASLEKRAMPAPPELSRSGNGAASVEEITMSDKKGIVDARNLSDNMQHIPETKIPKPSATVETKQADEAASVRENEALDAKSVQTTATGSAVRDDSKTNELKSISVPGKESEYKKKEALSSKDIRQEDFSDAVRYYDQGKYSRALSLFNSIAKSDSLRADDANWFQALIYLKMNKPEKARPLLQSLSAKICPRQLSADSLLKTLN